MTRHWRVCVFLGVASIWAASGQQLGDPVLPSGIDLRGQVDRADVIVVGTITSVSRGVDRHRVRLSEDAETELSWSTVELENGRQLRSGQPDLPLGTVKFHWWTCWEQSHECLKYPEVFPGDRWVVLLRRSKAGALRPLQDVRLPGVALTTGGDAPEAPVGWAVQDKISHYLLTPGPSIQEDRFSKDLMRANASATLLSGGPFTAQLLKKLVASSKDPSVRVNACLALALGHASYGQDDCLRDLVSDSAAPPNVRSSARRLLSEKASTDARIRSSLERVGAWREDFDRKGLLDEYCRSLSNLTWHPADDIRASACRAYADVRECVESPYRIGSCEVP